MSSFRFSNGAACVAGNGYAIYGALLSAVASVLISGGLGKPQALNLITVVVCFAFLGAASATVYWWIAGRFAGRALNAPA